MIIDHFAFNDRIDASRGKRSLRAKKELFVQQMPRGHKIYSYEKILLLTIICIPFLITIRP